jgi:magnesium chelatase subunit D
MNEKILDGLACLAVNPGLQSILFLDVPNFYIKSISDMFEKIMIETGEPVKTVYIPADASEDKLWSYSLLRMSGKDDSRVDRYSFLVQNSPPDTPRVLVIPDLANSGLPVKRALTVILDSPTAKVERHGYFDEWVPNIRCLAFCQKADLVCLSRHLLDRFSIRIDAGSLVESNDLKVRAKKLLTRINKPGTDPIDTVPVPTGLIESIKKGKQFNPVITDTALEEILSYIQYNEGLGHRREIALARMSAAFAALDGSNIVDTSHVRKAAVIQGIKIYPTSDQSEEYPQTRGKSDEGDEDAPISPGSIYDEFQADQVKLDLHDVLMHETPDIPRKADLIMGEDMVTSDMKISFFPDDIFYPEDNMESEPIIANLKDFGTARKGRYKSGGAITGSTYTKTLEDIALFDTIRAALPYQKYRRRKPGEPLCIKYPDLRQNTRRETPGKMMILLVDISDSIEERLEEVIKKELEWAYAERALISLTLVGATAGAGMRAQNHMFSSRQLASINSLLKKGGKGQATPLAHGLYVSSKQIDKVTQHSRNAVREVRFIVITDGRANIPLSVSLGEKDAELRGGLKAFEDVLAVAGKIRRHPKVKTLLLCPEVKYHPELPKKLALALGTQFKTINQYYTDA